MIIAASVSGSGGGTVVTDTASVQHPVPAEGLSVVLPSALTLPSGMTVGPTAPGQSVVIFQQPAPSAALDIEGSNALAAGTAAAIHKAEND